VKDASTNNFFYGAIGFESGIELKERFRPKSAFGQSFFNGGSNRRVSNVQEALDVTCIVIYYVFVGKQNVHFSFLPLASWHQYLFPRTAIIERVCQLMLSLRGLVFRPARQNEQIRFQAPNKVQTGDSSK
jgi:hypothetical protein